MKTANGISKQVLGALALALVAGLASPAQTISWKGHTWNVTNGGMAGVAPGSPSNITIDANGYLHMKIVKSGSSWTAAELFTTENLGFGTYQWQFEGAVDNFDKCVVLGLFPYGPAAGIGGDGENEIDIEFSKWNGEVGAHNADFTYYPATGYGDGNFTPSDYDEFTVSLGGATLSTARTVWSSKTITGTIMTGQQPVGTTANVLHTHTYAPASNWTQKIPQVAVPLGMNFWCYGTTPASNQEIIVRDFQFVPEGSQPVNYTITASAGTGGSISPSGSVTVAQGGSQTFTFTASAGYTISAVTVDGSNKGVVPSYVFSNVQAAHTISVAFTPSTPTQYTITSSAGTGGSISPSGAVKVNQGGSQTFAIAANSGYTVASVLVDGVNQGAITSYTFPNVQAAHTISASFTPSAVTQFTITSSAGTGGTISPSGSVKVNQGASQTFTVTPNSGYTIGSLLVDGTNLGATSSYTFSNVQAAHTISASFNAATGDSNLAPSGTGYLWSKNSSATSNSNRKASSAINDNNLTNSVVVNAAGEGGSAKWEGAGVVWSAAKSISSAKFVNGVDDGYDNGYFQASCKLQFSTDGTTWADSGWAISPAYPNSTSAYGNTYTFSGTAKTGVKGARIVGQTGSSSWSWTVSEVLFIGH